MASPSRSSSASCSPVDAPDGTIARPSAPPSSPTSASTVGLPRESRTSRACSQTISVMRGHYTGAVRGSRGPCHGSRDGARRWPRRGIPGSPRTRRASADHPARRCPAAKATIEQWRQATRSERRRARQAVRARLDSRRPGRQPCSAGARSRHAQGSDRAHRGDPIGSRTSRSLARSESRRGRRDDARAGDGVTTRPRAARSRWCAQACLVIIPSTTRTSATHDHANDRSRAPRARQRRRRRGQAARGQRRGDRGAARRARSRSARSPSAIRTRRSASSRSIAALLTTDVDGGDRRARRRHRVRADRRHHASRSDAVLAAIAARQARRHREQGAARRARRRGVRRGRARRRRRLLRGRGVRRRADHPRAARGPRVAIASRRCTASSTAPRTTSCRR